ncbi:MAG: sigma-E processing peptidase SpoIIGA [Bacillota bacterium]|nr:sigma-E processing peptidase SpoIIGA [Bacillota bacterium]
MVLEVNLGAYLLLFGLLCGQMAVLLWAAGSVVGLRPVPGRLAAGAVAGAVYTVLTDLAGFGLFPLGFLKAWYGIVGVSLLTHALVYWPLPAGRLLQALGSYYFLAVIGAGVGYTAYNLGVRGWLLPLLTIGVILAAAELGWGVVQRWVWDRVVYLPLEIDLLGRTARVTALLDTGNRLVDPLTGQPVVILGSDLREALLPPEAVEAVAAAATSPVEAVGRLAETPLATRVRLIPYSTLGQENGLLLSFRADAVRLGGGATGPETGPETGTLVAFHGQPLDPAGAYRALVHPALLQAALARASRRRGRLTVGSRLDAGDSISRLGG